MRCLLFSSAEKRLAGPSFPQQRDTNVASSAQDAKKKKLVVEAGPLKAGPEESAYDLVSRQTEMAAIPIVKEDTHRSVAETASSNIAAIDALADLSPVSSVDTIPFPLSPEPEWEKILNDLETELNMFAVPTSQPDEKEKKKEEGTSLLSQLLTSQRPVREEYAKIEKEPEPPPMSPLLCLPTPPQDDGDSGFQSPSLPEGSPNPFSPLSITPGSPESFSPVPFSFNPTDPSAMPLSCPAQYNTAMLPPYDGAAELTYPPVRSAAPDWMFQPAPEAWEMQMFSSPTVYPGCQPTLDNTDELLANLIPSMCKDEVAIGRYLL